MKKMKSKYLIAICFILVWMSFTGQNISSAYQTNEIVNETAIIISSLVFTIAFFFIGLIFPVYKRLSNNGKPFNNDEIKRISKLNSAFLLSITIFATISNESFMGFGIIGVIMFYFLTKKFLSEKNF